MISQKAMNCSTFHGLVYTLTHTIDQLERNWAPTSMGSPAHVFLWPNYRSLLSWLNDFPLQQKIEKGHLKSLKTSARVHRTKLMQKPHLRSVSIPDAQAREHLSSQPVVWKQQAFAVMRKCHRKCGGTHLSVHFHQVSIPKNLLSAARKRKGSPESWLNHFLS